jgi:D-alanyl-D-alanine carboxypeptidase (penicillin-binding protein 5/6)
MAECIGVKTGFTRPAQQVLVSAATRSGKEVVSVVMHTNKPGIWDDSKLLLEHGLTKLTAPPPPAPVPATASAGQAADPGAAKEATPPQPADAPVRPPGS